MRKQVLLLHQDKVLILDDDSDILELLEFILQKNGYKTVGISDSKEIDIYLYDNRFSLLIIDRTLPCIDGVNLVEKLRDQGDITPVIFLTAKNSQQEKLEGFKSGGDDYITKPFDIDELVMRVEAVIRRSRKAGFLNMINHKDIEMNLDKLEVSIENNSVKLTKLEFRLLQTFLENIGKVLNRDFLLNSVWNCGVFDENCNAKSVNIAVKRLKQKIDINNSKKYIESIRGVGYKFR